MCGARLPPDRYQSDTVTNRSHFTFLQPKLTAAGIIRYQDAYRIGWETRKDAYENRAL
jgi:hypothetical protein